MYHHCHNDKNHFVVDSIHLNEYLLECDNVNLDPSLESMVVQRILMLIILVDGNVNATNANDVYNVYYSYIHCFHCTCDVVIEYLQNVLIEGTTTKTRKGEEEE